MPSLMDVDGHSGWGVRLCNVKLREGVVLMTLPGKKRVRRRKKKKSKMQKEPEREPEVMPEPAETGSRSWGWSKKKVVSVAAGGEKTLRATPVVTAPAPITTTSTIKDKPVSPTNGTQSFYVIKEHQFNDEHTALSSDAELQTQTFDDKDDPESTLSSRVPSPTLICSQQRGMLSCLTREGKKESVDGEDQLYVPEASQSRADASISKITDDGVLVQDNVVFDTNHLGVESATPEEGKINTESTTHEQNGDEDDDDDFYWAEQDMVLKLSTGGRIGTLDVRLVGKDLHIMVEEAYLTVEACPKPDDTDETSAAPPPSAAAADDKKNEAEDKKRKSNPPKNVAERILERSGLAKAISAIPHLLLRDCTIRLIVRENESGGEDEVGPLDSVVEVGVELFSVTSGDDFMAGFRSSEEEGQKEQAGEMEASPRKMSLKRLEEDDENEYLMKRIRTGKGPEGGIFLKVFPPRRSVNNNDQSTNRPACAPWAVHMFRDRAEFCLFRCSGLDARARIYLGKKMEIALRNNDYTWYGEEYDEYTIDSMLYGVDYIAPGPPPPLPPLNRQLSGGITKKATGTDLYTIDQNGVQSCKITSAFHKVARGLTPILCKKNHLPGDSCPYCWENSARPNSYSEHPLDSSTPLPGIVFHLSLNEALEVNVDRGCLEVLGNLQSLFTKKVESSKTPPTSTADVNRPDVNKEEEERGTKKWSFGRTVSKKESLKDAFPSYMLPENIEFMGAHLSKIVVRLHVMQSDGRDDTRGSFRFWEAVANCITVDFQSMNTKPKVFNDVRVGLGYFSTTEFRGTEHKKFVCLGLPQAASFESDPLPGSAPKVKSKSNWPSTASVLLHVSVPAESEQYESTDSHGIQMRYVSLDTKSSSAHTERACVNVRLGKATVDAKFSAINDVMSILDQSMLLIFGKAESPVSAETKQQKEASVQAAVECGVPATSLMQYKVQIDGGILGLDPLVQVRFPSTKFGGESTAENGLFFETLLKQVEVEYGKRAVKPMSTRQSLSLAQIASLPESVRLRILLLLKDLTPLEKALKVSKESNSFLRCRAVNKAIVQYGTRPIKPVVKPRKKRVEFKPMPRQDILNALMKLDDTGLGELWKMHQASLQKKKTITN